MRAGQLQVRAEAVKRASLSTMIEKAKAEGFFDEEEAKAGILPRARVATEEEKIEMVDEEGNVVAGESVTVDTKADQTEDFLGPLGRWVVTGMKTDEAMAKLGLKNSKESKDSQDAKEGAKSSSSESFASSDSSESSLSTRISIHTIELPARAPRQLLLDLKRTFETFPGKEKVQLKIGEQLVPVPLTITMSAILEKKIEEIMDRHRTQAEA
jgi:hypothetical protein